LSNQIFKNMAQNNANYIKWQIPNYRKPERNRRWYILASIFIVIALFSCFFGITNWRPVFLGYTSNFLFALIIILASIIMIINENQPVNLLDCELGPEGFKLAGRLYEYNSLRNFSVVYKPRDGLKNLYFEFKSSTKQRLSVPLRSLDPLAVRNFLLRYLKEDLERTDVPLSEQLTKLLKL